MLNIDEKIPEMPKGESPLKPILEWYNAAREIANAPSLVVEAYYLDISLPRLRNIIDTNQFNDEQIELLDKHRIELNLAAGISQLREHWDEILNHQYLEELVLSDSRLTDLYFIKKGDSIDTVDIMKVFHKESFCGKVYQQRIKKFGKPKKGFEKMLQSILRQIAQGKEPSPKQINAVFQAINQERDSSNFNWTSASLKKNCPKSVELIQNWDGN